MIPGRAARVWQSPGPSVDTLGRLSQIRSPSTILPSATVSWSFTGARTCARAGSWQPSWTPYLAAGINEPWLRELEERDTLFPMLDYRIYTR
jgi:hypothetical protein